MMKLIKWHGLDITWMIMLKMKMPIKTKNMGHILDKILNSFDEKWKQN